MQFAKNLTRLKTAVSKLYHMKGVSVDVPINERVGFLRELEGEYDIPPYVNMSMVPRLVKMLLDANNMGADEIINNTTPKGEKLGKWLFKSHIPEEIISQTFATVIPAGKFEITCKFNDIIRMSESKHFDSCLRIGSGHENETQILYNLWDKHIALIVMRDSKGDFVYRRLIGVGDCTPFDNTPILRINRKYGNGPSYDIIRKAIQNKHKELRTQFTCARSGFSSDQFIYRPEPIPHEMRVYHRWDDAVSEIEYSRYSVSTEAPK